MYSLFLLILFNFLQVCFVLGLVSGWFFVLDFVLVGFFFCVNVMNRILPFFCSGVGKHLLQFRAEKNLQPSRIGTPGHLR